MFDFRRGKAFSGLSISNAFKAIKRPPVGPDSPLQETQKFGTNPGQLRMFSYVPQHAARPTALVVVLHGCGQNAAGYNRGAGWSTLADRFGFALLMPEQQRTNNPNGCFNWFEQTDTRRDCGEAASINQMVAAMVRDSGVDARRVFITGLSAGGAMTAVMLACYPDTFAAGAIIAGLPYGAASNVQEAMNAMYQCRPRSAKQWGDFVREASPPRVRSWPRVSIWHGSADRTVIPSNAIETLKQWTDVHGVTGKSPTEDSVEGCRRQVWLSEGGAELIESYTIAHMGHGTPLATGDAEFECGAAGPFLLDVGISSSFHIARFFGLVRADALAATKAACRSNSAPESDELHDDQMPSGITKGDAGPRTEIGAIISAALAKAGLLNRG